MPESTRLLMMMIIPYSTTSYGRHQLEAEALLFC